MVGTKKKKKREGNNDLIGHLYGTKVIADWTSLIFIYQKHILLSWSKIVLGFVG